jgi:hypothetical protein
VTLRTNVTMADRHKLNPAMMTRTRPHPTVTEKANGLSSDDESSITFWIRDQSYTSIAAATPPAQHVQESRLRAALRDCKQTAVAADVGRHI